jgi:hypothetical protein
MTFPFAGRPAGDKLPGNLNLDIESCSHCTADLAAHKSESGSLMRRQWAHEERPRGLNGKPKSRPICLNRNLNYSSLIY